ncbi:ATP-binding protein [Pedobacter alpinus]|uniref:histidine kinase n=1 Tax=Pedobacter alpinus TaxID=1590643 RepID=A0ABW5TR22_9SPHI
MRSKISVFNWSFNKSFSDEKNSLDKAKCKILYSIFLIFFLKVICVLITSIYFDQNIQFIRAVIFLSLYLVLFRCFLLKLLSFKTIAHIIVLSSLLLISSNLFVTAKSVNIITIQFAFSLVLCSFFIINSAYGFFYSSLAIALIMTPMLFGSKYELFANSDGALASPGFELIVILNFISIIFIPYLFVEAFIKTIKEKEALNLQLLASVEVANEAAQSKSNFLSTMSHELRTPLNAVIGTTNLLLSDTYHKDQESNLNDLKFSASCLLDIVNDILDFNKLDSSNLKLETIKVNLENLIERVCSGLVNQANEKGIELKIAVNSEISNYDVFTDPTRITQIIYNLVGNAIKFTAKGNVSILLDILSKNNEYLKIRFSIKDTGIGVNEDKMNSIFEPFNQASSSITRNYGGTGLGLSIVKRLISLFNSEIKLESKIGEGSNFYFDIDFKYSQKTLEKEQEILTEVYNISDLNILVAEDNLMNRVLIKKVLSKWNNEPVFAIDGLDAIEISKNKTFDVILMDLHMPKIDGYEASKAIRNDASNINQKTPIIAFTASVSNTILEDIELAGMNDFIYKPFNVDEMYNKLRNIKNPKA